MSMIDPALPGAQIGSLGGLGEIRAPEPRPGPPALAVINAALERENSVVSTIDALWNGMSVSSTRDPDYDPWADIQGTPYEEYWSAFADSANAGMTTMLKNQIDDEREGNQILSAAGGFGFAASVAAGILDPTILIPVGGELKLAATGGRAIVRSAGSVALAGGTGTAISEGLLQGSQVTRTTQESVLAVGSGALLSGFLGAGAAALLNRVDKNAYEATLKAFETLNENTANPPPRPTSAGAMAVDTFGLEDLSPSTTGGFGKAINVVAAASKWVGPNMRLQFSPSPVSRRIAQQLNEGSLFQRRHDERGTLGPAVETLARGLFEGRLATANKQYNAIWLEAKKSTKGMSRRDFNNAVGTAMRRNDESANPFVARAAQLWRKTMYEPYLNDAINVGSLPADVSVETAASYLNRVWNRAALVNGREKFLAINADYFGKNLARNFETDTEALAKRKEKVESQIRLLKLSPEERAAALADVEARGAALEAANVENVNRVSTINDLRAQLKEARKRGDAATVKLLAEQVAAEQAAGGERLLGYLADRARLRDERRRVDMNIAGVNDRLDKTLQALVDLEEKNIASLNRLISRGRVLEREIQRLDPAKARAKVSDLRNSFIRLAEQADRALDRQAAALAKMDEASAKAKAEGKGVDVAAGERDARARAMIDKEVERQQKRSDQMNRVAERLEAAEALDVDATLLEVKSAVDELVQDVSRLSMQKGEKAARLKARLERLDPEKVKAKEAELREAALKAERDYNGRWIGFQDEDQNVVRVENRVEVSGTFRLRHGAEMDLKDGFSPDFKSQGERGGNFGLGGVYLDADGKWTNNSDLLQSWHIYDADVTFKKAFLLTPETIADFWKATGRSETTAGKVAGRKELASAVDALKKDGYDGIVVQGFDDTVPVAPANMSDADFDAFSAAYETLGKKLGVDPDLMQDQVYAFDAKSVKLGEEIAGPQRRVDAGGVPFDNFVSSVPEGRALSRVNFSPDVRKTETRTPSFLGAGRDIGADVYDKLIGLDSQVGASQALSNIGLSPLKRGPLKDRTYQIPDELIEEFLESDIEEIASIYGRTMAGEVELTRQFGSADMSAQIDEIVANYRELKDAAGAAATGKQALAALPDDLASAYEGPVTRNKVLEFLDKSERSDLDDIKATRDLVRGTYKAAENASTMGGIARNLGAFNYLRLMGGVLLANLTETVRPAMVVGWKPYLAEGIAPLLTNLKAIKLSIADGQMFGVATERYGQNRLVEMGEIGDPMRRGTPFDRMAGNLVNTASRWSGLVYFTDAMKGISSVLVQNRIINSILDGKNDRLISFLEISPANAERIAEQFRLHGETRGNTRIANLSQWTDGEALRAYGAAVRKDVNSIIVTKAAGDVPLFANEPAGKILLQFRSYMLASHQKVLMRGMQESKTNFLSGMMGMTVVGMMAAYLRAWRGGDERRRKFEEAASNPGYLIAEGLDLSGIFAIPFEAANTTEKLLKGVSSDLAGTGLEGVSLNPIKTPLLLGGKLVNPNASLQGSSTRFANVDPEGALLGPSANLLGDIARGPLATASALATGQTPTEAELRTTKKLVPFAGYPGIHEMLQVLTDDSPYLQNAPADQ